MRRTAHITVTLMMVLLLFKPFDCFSSGTFTQKAADCCKKGKCVPSSNADDCCKGTLPGGKQLVAAKPSLAQSNPLPDLNVALEVPVAAPHALRVATARFERGPSPPGSPPDSRRNLPLLI